MKWLIAYPASRGPGYRIYEGTPDLNPAQRKPNTHLMKGITIFGWLTVLMPFFLLLGEFSGARRPVPPSKILALGVGAAVMLIVGVGLLKRIKVARTAFLTYTFLLSFTLLGGLIYRRMPPLESPTAVGLLLYGVFGFCYFMRPTVKAHFRTEAGS